MSPGDTCTADVQISTPLQLPLPRATAILATIHFHSHNIIFHSIATHIPTTYLHRCSPHTGTAIGPDGKSSRDQLEVKFSLIACSIGEECHTCMEWGGSSELDKLRNLYSKYLCMLYSASYYSHTPRTHIYCTQTHACTTCMVHIPWYKRGISLRACMCHTPPPPTITHHLTPSIATHRLPYHHHHTCTYISTCIPVWLHWKFIICTYALQLHTSTNHNTNQVLLF